MKKQLHALILASILLLSASIQAQVTLTATGINPTVGENFTLTNSAYVSPGSSGASQTWNLSAMSGSSAGLTNVITPASTLVGASFPSANVALSNTTLNTTIFYYKTSATALHYYGSYAGYITKPYSNPEDVLHFPLNYTDTYTDTWNNQYVNGSFTYYQRGTTTVTNDGYGTLITPTGSYNNVARVRLQQAYNDSTYSGFPLVTTFTSDQYFWYMNGTHIFIANVYTTTNNLGGPSSGGSYITAATSVNERDNLITNYSLYPNPVQDKLTIHFQLENINDVEVKIFNTLGALVKQEKIQHLQTGLNSISLNTKELSNGIYFAQLQTGNIVETKRFVVSK